MHEQQEILIFGPNTMGICNPYTSSHCMVPMCGEKQGALVF